ncbi:SixA phosphatase family protein [Chachezhania antarctica]|uniref:SixA phosphatase family protein n=1 Tax=Chachezhania antarctica TaxID=2340860 RepID=UPI0013CE5687|nr:histidine phosphatase family protein [Chachezhania antarctica]
MTRTLILMRHAKSSWGDPGLDDHDRPLNNRGRRSAVALGAWLAREGFVPDQVLCSTATRTQHTFKGLGIGVQPSLRPDLYHADPADMLAALRDATGQTVLLIGHNPGIADFAQQLVANPPQHDRFEDYPTGATLVARFDIEVWTALEPGTGAAAGFVIPRELTDG